MSVQLENHKAESALLGAVIANEEFLDGLEIRAEDFSRFAHRKVFEAIQNVKARNKPIDAISVSERLSEVGQLEEVGGSEFISTIARSASTDERKVENYSNIVRGLSLKRQIKSSLSSMVDLIDTDRELSASDIIERVQANVFDFGSTSSSNYSQMHEVAKAVEQRIENALAHAGQVTGVTTGYAKLDRITGGWQSTDMIVIAARPGMGKTALLLNLLDNAASDGVPVGVFSLEMSKEQLAMRLVSRRTGVSMQRMMSGMMNPDEAVSIAKATDQMAYLPISIDDRVGISEMDIMSAARRMVKNHAVKMVGIDYLQRIVNASPSGNEPKDLGTICKSMKNMARQLKIPVILLAQLNRELERRDDKRPQLSDLKGSGDIEQEADIITFIYRDDYYRKDSPEPGIAEIDVAKFRNGRTGMVKMAWNGAAQAFSEIVGVSQ